MGFFDDLKKQAKEAYESTLTQEARDKIQNSFKGSYESLQKTAKDTSEQLQKYADQLQKDAKTACSDVKEASSTDVHDSEHKPAESKVVDDIKAPEPTETTFCERVKQHTPFAKQSQASIFDRSESALNAHYQNAQHQEHTSETVQDDAQASNAKEPLEDLGPEVSAEKIQNDPETQNSINKMLSMLRKSFWGRDETSNNTDINTPDKSLDDEICMVTVEGREGRDDEPAKRETSWFGDTYTACKERIESLFTSKDTPLKEKKIKELEKAKLISILHTQEDGTKLIRIRGVPFMYILDGQSARESGKLVWKLGVKVFPYIMEMAIGKIASKNILTRIGHQGLSLYSRFKK